MSLVKITYVVYPRLLRKVKYALIIYLDDSVKRLSMFFFNFRKLKK